MGYYNGLHICHLEVVGQYDGEVLTAHMKRFQEAINKFLNLNECEALKIIQKNFNETRDASLSLSIDNIPKAF